MTFCMNYKVIPTSHGADLELVVFGGSCGAEHQVYL